MPKKKSAKPKPRTRNCATLQVHFGLLDKFPQFRANQGAIESFTRRATLERTETMRTGVVTIPVVVHVVHRVPAENISEAQIKSQIRVLNRDYRATNTDLSKVPKPF